MSNPPAAPAPWLARLAPGLFAIPVGLFGLAGAWMRVVPLGITLGNPISLGLFLAATLVLLALLLLFAAKLVRHPAAVRADWRHPVQGALLSLLPVSLLLFVTLTAPVFAGLAGPLWVITLAALALQATATWQVVARLSAGEFPREAVTVALVLPTVAGGLVGALALNALGQPGWAALLVGIGLGAWGVMEFRVLNRLYDQLPPPPLRAMVGLEIAPAAVGALAVASVWPQLPAEPLLVCLGIASTKVFAVLTRWRHWTATPFSAGFWSFSFPLAALAGVTVEAVRRGGWPVEVALATLVVVSGVIAYLAARTLILVARGRLLSPV
jgi:tellurite resistance protein